MFMDEGFNDFIAKPIELSVLERMLRRYIPVQKQINVEEDTLDDAEENVQTDETPISIVKKEKTEKTREESLSDLEKAGINVQQGLSYCGDRDGFREIVTIYHSEGARRNKQLEQFFQNEDWKNYVIMVHALKSNSKGIGASELAELALNLEMAGKENRTSYILEHHEELLEKHTKLLSVIAENTFIYPDGYHADTEDDTAEDDVLEEVIQTPQISDESDVQSMMERIAHLREKLDSFESE